MGTPQTNWRSGAPHLQAGPDAACKRPSPTKDKILAFLCHYPEGLTLSEIVAETGLTMSNTRTIIRYDRSKHGTANFRILRYEPTRGRGGSLQPVYVNSPGPDARKPKFDPIQNRRRIQARYRGSRQAIINARIRVSRGTRSIHPFAAIIQGLTK